MANKIEVELYKTNVVSVENGYKLEEALRLLEANNYCIDESHIKEVINTMNILNVDFEVKLIEESSNKNNSIFEVFVPKTFSTIMVIYYLKNL